LIELPLSCCVEVKKRVSIVDADESDDDEFFDAVEESPVSTKSLTLPRRPKRWNYLLGLWRSYSRNINKKH